MLYKRLFKLNVVTSLWRKCEVATHTPENGTWESSGTPKNSKHNCRCQKILHWGVFYIVEKVLKCRCQNGLTWDIWTSKA
jgi:hypothetical protein